MKCVLLRILVILFVIGWWIFLYSILFVSLIFSLFNILCMVDLLIDNGKLYMCILSVCWDIDVVFEEYGFVL